MNIYKRFGLVLFAGLLIGAINAVDALSFAALIYTGGLKQHMLYGISAGLVGSAILLLLMAIWSSSAYTISSSQDIMALLAALTGASLVKSMHQSGMGVDPLPTLLCAIAIMGVLMGVSMYLLGLFRLGKLVRYIPYPVIAGFLAGTGWLLLMSILGSLTHTHSNVQMMEHMSSLHAYWAWLVPLLFGMALLAAQLFVPGVYSIAGVLLLGFAGFYGYVWLQGLSITDAQHLGLTIGPFPTGNIPLFPNMAIRQGVQWGPLMDHMGEYFAATVLGVISLLLNLSGFEFTAKKNMDIDRELKLTGLGNVAVGAVGGIAGYHVLSRSKTNWDFQLNSRWVGIISGLVAIAILFAGTSPLNYLPGFIFTGLLISIGLDFLVQWLFKVKQRISWLDYAIVWSILIVIVLFGLLTGIVVGLLMSLSIFFFRYSRIPVVASFLSGQVLHSQVERNEADKMTLEQLGERILVISVRGYLFFGNAYEMALRVGAHMAKMEHHPSDIPFENPRAQGYLVFNFRQVTGMEVSGTMSFINLMYQAKERNMLVVFAHLPEPIANALERLRTLEHQTIAYQRFPDIDHALGWCEDELLRLAKMKTHPDFETLFAMTFKNIKAPEALLAYAQKKRFQAGEVLCREGEPSKEMYWIASGELEAVVAYEQAGQKRLRHLLPGSTVGEMAIFLNEPRSATVIAKTECVAYCFAEQHIQRMNRENPALALAFNQSLLAIIAKRLQYANRLLASQEKIY